MQNKKLELALRANAIFSTSSGFSMLFFNETLSTWMGISQPQILMFIGIGLIVFALFLFRTAQQKMIPAKEVKIIIWQDWLWVIGSVLIIVTQSFGLNTMGYIIIGVVAFIVADFAVLQRMFLRNE